MSEDTHHSPETPGQPSGLEDLLGKISNFESLPGIISTPEEAAAVLEKLIPDVQAFVETRYPGQRKEDALKAIQTGDTSTLKQVIGEMQNTRQQEVIKAGGKPKQDRELQTYDFATKIINAHLLKERQKSLQKPEVPTAIIKSMSDSNLNPSRR